MKTKTLNTELRRMTADELRRDIAMHVTEYAKIRMGVEMQKEKNHALSKSKRREIARMKTVLSEMMNPKHQKNVKTVANSASSSVTDSPKKPSQTAKKPVKVPRSK